MLKSIQLSELIIHVITNLAILFFFSTYIYAASEPARAEPIKILFIGNSYTHMNDMPLIFERIAKAAGKEVKVEKNTRSGASLRIHSEREDMYEAIKQEKWDWTVC